MSEEPKTIEEKSNIGRLFIPSLSLSRYSTTPRGVILTLLLIEIGRSFGVPVGIAGQVGTATSVAAFTGSLIMGLLTVKFKQKTLLMTGLIILGISTLGLYLAPSFPLFMICAILSGLGASMIMPVSTSLVAVHLPRENRAGVISLLMATIGVSYIIGTPVIQYITGLGGWRLSYLIYALPLPLLSLLISLRGIPSESSSQIAAESGNIVDGYKGVLSKISADVCLICNSLSAASWAGIGLYAISFFRQQYAVSLGFATSLLIALAILFTFGTLISGKFVNRFGRKNVTCVFILLTGVFTFFFTISPNLWISIFLVSMACIASGVRTSSHISLTLEQVPEYRGTMMSISAASANLGSALGSGVGGAALLWFGYRAIGPSLGLLGLVSAILLWRFVADTADSQS